MTTFITGEIVQVKVAGRWQDAEILDITATGAYVYLQDTGKRVNVRIGDIRA